MTYELTFLAGKKAAQKHFLVEHGVIHKTPYPMLKNFTSVTEEVTDLKDFRDALVFHAKEGHALLKGSLTRPITDESRAGLTQTDAPSQWICFDIDEMPGVTSAKDFIALLPVEFHNVSYIEQASSSAYIAGYKEYAAHLFFLLPAPLTPSIMRNVMINLNLTCPAIESQLALNPAATTIKWIIDPCINQNSRLIYIAPPAIDGMKPAMSLAKGIKFHKKDSEFLVLPPALFVPNDAREKLNELRRSHGLPDRRRDLSRRVNGTMVEKNPEQVAITGIKEDRGYIYFNFNGGDSWAYWVRADEPEIVYNFKDEPNYALEDLDFTLYQELKDKVRQRLQENTKSHYFVVNDSLCDKYAKVIYNYELDSIDVTYTSSLQKAIQFLKDYKQPVPDVIQDWEIDYDLQSDTIIDPENRFINLYSRSKFMRQMEVVEDPVLPHSIFQLLEHVFDHDQICIEHFLNWLAVIVQHRCKTQTAWIMQGTFGTGKGMLFNSVITPILGHAQCTSISVRDLASEFNAYARKTLVILVDEMHILEERKQTEAMATLKHTITEESMLINQKYRTPANAMTYCNLIIASNERVSLPVSRGDRRFNIAPRQETPMREVMDVDTLIRQIPKDLQDFTNYLNSRKADRDLAKVALDNSHKKELITLSEDSNVVLLNAISDGDLDFLVENAPGKCTKYKLALHSAIRNPKSFVELMDEFISLQGTQANLHRDDLHSLLYYINDLSFKTHNKCARFLSAKGFPIKAVKINNQTARGLQGISWTISDPAREQWEQIKEQLSLQSTE